MNDSLETLHPAENAGKTAVLNAGAKREERSRRTVRSTKYLSLKLKLALANSEAKLQLFAEPLLVWLPVPAKPPSRYLFSKSSLAYLIRPAVKNSA